MKIKIRGTVYDVEIFETGDKVKIVINGKEFVFEGENQKKPLPAQVVLPKRTFDKKEIKSPLTGTITKVFVKKNDLVKISQKVCLLSSMKMENEIVSDFEGRVNEILVKEGQNVKEGQVLLILK